jgi:hypothetical protein
MSKISENGKKVHLKHIDSFQDRYGHWRWYFRHRDGKRHAMPDPGNPLAPCSEFMLLYEKLVAVRDAEKASPQRGNPDHIVYFALKGRYVKIGYTKNPKARISSLQTGTHGRVFFLYMTPGARELERELHNKFKHLRAKGEWFLYGREIKEWITADEASRLKEALAETEERRQRRYGDLPKPAPRAA